MQERGPNNPEAWIVHVKAGGTLQVKCEVQKSEGEVWNQETTLMLSGATLKTSQWIESHFD